LLGGLSIHAQTEPAEVANPTSQASNLGPHLYIGYLSYDSALVSMPQYAIAQGQIQEMRQAYNEELKRVEDEFNQKYEDFLDGQRDFPRTILQKRQTELQELMERNIQFKEQGRQELADAERQAMAPLRIRLIELLSTIGREKGYAFIYDTDTKALPFLNIDFGEDINQLVQDALK
jgi:outer membrane protein